MRLARLTILSLLSISSALCGFTLTTSFDESALSPDLWTYWSINNNGSSALLPDNGRLEFTASPLDSLSHRENATSVRLRPTLEAGRDFSVAASLHNAMEQANAEPILLLQFGHGKDDLFSSTGYLALVLRGTGALVYTNEHSSQALSYNWGTLLDSAPASLDLSLHYSADSKLLTISQGSGPSALFLGSLGFADLPGTIQPPGLAPADISSFAIQLAGAARSPEILPGAIYFDAFSVAQIPEPGYVSCLFSVVALATTSIYRRHRRDRQVRLLRGLQ